MIGSTLAHYRITAKLGEGGMGEVWRAEDGKLGREVAVKVVPELFSQDPERLARFEREARVLASLSHANIAGVFGLEEHEGRRFLVMELAEGETLADRLARGPMRLEDAVAVGLQIAQAVEAAHEKGVVHRDLKPGNVMVDAKGRVKVLDFGLAKAMAPDPISGERDLRLSFSPTLTQAMTGAGVLLGTAGYMSPEQARGKEVDRRTDIWAFGCVLYEMLAGSRAFDGETVTDVLGAIVHKEPELEKLPPGVPRKIRRVLEQCLQKDVDRRLQSIGDARIALQEWIENPEADAEAATGARPRWQLWALAAATGAVGLVAGLALHRGVSAPEPPRRHLEVDLAQESLWAERGSAAVLSPDGSLLAYVTDAEDAISLRLRPMDRLESLEIARGDGPTLPHQPFFSPDGKWLGFLTRSELKKVPVTGGSPITLSEVREPRGASWGPDGRIVFAPGSRGGLSVIASAGGEVTPLTEVAEDEGVSHRWPQWLPGGRAVLFTVTSREGTQHLEVVEVASGERKVVHPNGVYGRYVASGHVLFVDHAALFALPFDPERLEATGSPMPVLEGIESQQADGEAQFDVSTTGDLVYKHGSGERSTFEISWADRAGRFEPLWAEPGFYGTPRLSPDGKRLAVSMLREDNWEVWIYDLERQVPTRLTFDAGYDADPVWSPDGRWLAFASDRDGQAAIFRKRSDGAGQAEKIPGTEDLGAVYPYSWFPDGSRLAIGVNDGETGFDLWWLPVDGSGDPEPLLATQFGERDAKVSPDGRWLAYQSNETGRPEIFVRSLEGGGKWQISDASSFQPLWSGDGRELFFRSSEGLFGVSIDLGEEELRASRPQLLFGDQLGNPWGVTVPGYLFEDYDVAPDGQRFVVFPRRSSLGEPAKVRLFTGWLGELRRLTEASGS